MKTPTKSIAIFLVLLALAAVSGYVFVTRYIEGLTVKTTEAKEEVEKLEVKLGHVKGLRQAAQDTNDDRVKIESYIVQPGGSVSFITELEKVASSIGLTYTTDRIESRNTPELDAQGKEQLVISFNVQGYWSPVFKFLKLVESMPYSLMVEKVDLFAQDIVKTITVPVVTGTSTGTNTPEVKQTVVREGVWKANLLFTVVKVKEN